MSSKHCSLETVIEQLCDEQRLEYLETEWCVCIYVYLKGAGWFQKRLGDQCLGAIDRFHHCASLRSIFQLIRLDKIEEKHTS